MAARTSVSSFRLPFFLVILARSGTSGSSIFRVRNSHYPLTFVLGNLVFHIIRLFLFGLLAFLVRFIRVATTCPFLKLADLCL